MLTFLSLFRYILSIKSTIKIHRCNIRKENVNIYCIIMYISIKNSIVLVYNTLTMKRSPTE